MIGGYDHTPLSADRLACFGSPATLETNEATRRKLLRVLATEKHARGPSAPPKCGRYIVRDTAHLLESSRLLPALFPEK
jgi:hypothetical protein